jgi:hypothetical protein
MSPGESFLEGHYRDTMKKAATVKHHPQNQNIS